MRNLISSCLENAGYKVIQAKDGVELLSAVSMEHPECVLVYIDLPVINGYNASRIIKNSAQLKDIAIIICATEETSVYHFWSDNTLSNGLFVPTAENLSELPMLIENAIIINETTFSSRAQKNALQNKKPPTQNELLQLVSNAYDKELFDLYIIQSAYRAELSVFNMESLVREMIKTISGVYNYAALAIIINASPIFEFYDKAQNLSSEEFEDFRQICHSDFAEKLELHNEGNWQSAKKIVTNNKNVSGGEKLKVYEAFPVIPDKNHPFTIHVSSCRAESFNSRTHERIEFLTSVFSKLIQRAITFEKANKAEAEMRKAFSHFLPPKIIDDIISGGMRATATVGEKREVAILITDIRNFTTISEINEAEDVVKFLNNYFAIMGRIIKKHGGTIDKFMGDAIMALFGAPESYNDNGNRAANAALEMHEAIKDLQVNLTLPKNYTFSIGTGIHYGATIVGSIGSDEKREYTVIGDNVNIASRIEGLTKIYGAQIIISESVKNDLRDGQYVRHLDNVRVKGKSIPVAIYELAKKDSKLDEEFLHIYNKAINQYMIGNFDRAVEYFNATLKIKPDDKASKVLLERCKVYSQNHPENWDGSVTLTTK